MLTFPKPIRELQPHAIWWVIERVVIAGLIGRGGGEVFHVNWLALAMLSLGIVLFVRPMFNRIGKKKNGYTDVERLLLIEMWTECDMILSRYRRLDYDDRENTRLPFANHSWPEFGKPWSHTHAELYSLSAMTGVLKAKLNLLKLFLWPDWSDYRIPETNSDTVMVDFIANLQEITNYLKMKVEAAQAAKRIAGEESATIS